MVWNGAQFHMLVNHLPVIGFVGMVLALAVAVTVQSIDIKRFVLVATALVGLSALAPYLTGESAEEVIEHEPGVSESLIHEHEELAEIATVLSVITGVAAARHSQANRAGGAVTFCHQFRTNGSSGPRRRQD